MNKDLFYVKDLKNCINEDLSFFQYQSTNSRALCLQYHNSLIERELTSQKNDTVISHFNVDTPLITEYKKKYLGEKGTPFISVIINVDKIMESCDRLYTNNLFQKIHDRVYPLPLGIFRKEINNFNYLREIEKKNFCYANFAMTILDRVPIAKWATLNENIDCRFYKRFSDLDRKLEIALKDNKENIHDDVMEFSDFVTKLSSYRFCIVPNGVGIDTDRLWECIFLNVVPIVQHNYGNEIFSKIWPMILVKNYTTCDIMKLTKEFEQQHGKNIQYNNNLLFRENLPELLDRIQYECQNA
mgnify:CR=1 FL=1